MADMSPRAVDVLKHVDKIFAEDTRHSGPLLKYFNIQTQCHALHEHNERQISDKICADVLAGQSIALISDAGVPLISDPGFLLIKKAHESSLTIVPIPGPCAAITALSVSGLPSDQFYFVGFLPSKSSARIKTLTKLKSIHATFIFYESPHRILESLHDMGDVYGLDCTVVLARELTKMFETVKKTSLQDLLAFVSNDANQRKGEMVVLLDNTNVDAADAEQENLELERTLQILLDTLSLKQAVSLAVKLTGQKRNQVYPMALAISQNQEK